MNERLKGIDWLFLVHSGLILLLFIYLNVQLTNLAVLSSLQEIGYEFPIFFAKLMITVSVLGLSFYTWRFLTREFLIKLGWGYLLYLIISYFIKLTQNLNNKDFKLGNLEKNQFWQGNFLFSLLAIFFVSGLLVWLVKKYNWQEKLSFYQGFTSFFPSLIWGSIIINDSQFQKIIITPALNFLKLGQMMDYNLSLLVNTSLSLIIFSLLAYMMELSWRELRLWYAGKSLIVVSSIFWGVVFNYTLQLGVQKSESIVGRYIFSGATGFQILVLSLLAGIIYLLVNRYVLASFIIFNVGVLVSVANSIKETMRSEPLLLTDFAWLRNIFLVANSVDVNILWWILLGLSITGSLYWYSYYRFFYHKLFSWRERVLGFVIILLTFINLLLQPNSKDSLITIFPSLSRLENEINITWLGFTRNARYKSLMYVWAKQLTTPVIAKPNDYSKTSMEAIIKKYSQVAQEINKNRTSNITDQTVIYILSESLANPNRLTGVQISQNLLENIDRIKSETTSGLMESDSYGGGTANIEFQALTGLPFSNYSKSVSVLYSEVVPKMTYLPVISDFYNSNNRYVIHPENALNYNRQVIYQKLDFEHLIFLEGSKEKLNNINRVGVSVSDQTVYDNVLSNINPEDNQFFSVLTIQNHAPWVMGVPEEIFGVGEDFTIAQDENFTSYVRLLYQTDEATLNFLEKLKQIDKPITVVFYGDHLPGFYPESVFEKKPETKYQTDYFIWSNYQSNKLDYSLIRANDFPAALLAQTNAKVSPYYALLTQILDKENFDKDKQEEVERDLLLVQYDLSIGKGYLKKNSPFFTINN